MSMAKRYADTSGIYNPPRTQEEKQRVIDLRKSGKTLTDIRELTGIPVATQSRILKNAGFKMTPMPRRKMAAIQAMKDIAARDASGG